MPWSRRRHCGTTPAARSGRSIAAAVVCLVALAPAVVRPLAIPAVVLGAVAVSAGIWELARGRPEQGWYALGVALLLQLGVLAIWVVSVAVSARSFGHVLLAVALVGSCPASRCSLPSFSPTVHAPCGAWPGDATTNKAGGHAPTRV